MGNLTIRPGDRISIHHKLNGYYADAWVLHKFWFFGWWLKVVTYKSQNYITIPIGWVEHIINRNDIGKQVR